MMNVAAATGNVAQLDVEALVLGCAEQEQLSGPAVAVDAAMGGVLTRLLKSQELTGKASEITTILEPPGLKARILVVVGLGKEAAFERGTAFRSAAAASKHLARKQRSSVAFCLGENWTDELVETGIAAVLVGCQGQDLYRSEKKLLPFGSVSWWGASADALERGRILGEGINLARRLVNHPPNVIYPAAFAEIAAQICQECNVDCEIWDEHRLEAEECGSLLAVGRGSERPPRLLIMRYRGADHPPLVLVGKGVTFDSGGLSIKGTDGMKTMKCDMAGAATVLAAIQTMARCRLPVHVVGLAGLVENLISGSAFKLGDVLKSRCGKTIEVLNTDAEGRLVLADVLDVALEQQAAAIIDLATLTGACMVALGVNVAGLMTNHQSWCDRVAETARVCGEPVWQLPMFAEFAEQIRSSVADLKNVGEGRYGGAITAAKFLEEFVQGRPWVHVDIAGPAFLDNSRAWIDAGGTGVFVRTLFELARHWTGDVDQAAPTNGDDAPGGAT
jgi:leucyl aminopeptidase